MHCSAISLVLLMCLLAGTPCLAESDLKTLLDRIAVNHKVIAAVSNKDLISEDGQHGMLRMWIDGLRRVNCTNFMVISIDDGVAEVMDKLGVPYWRKTPEKTADKEESNHGISATKFQLVKAFLLLNTSVLLSDVDIIVLKNPFDFLYRDEDLESLTDGFDLDTAYGWDDVFDDPKMGWSRWAHSFHIFTLNSGLFYIRPNAKTIALMDRITGRLNKDLEWDQAVYNEEVWKPTAAGFKGSDVTVRIMDIYDFVNSKTLIRTMRHEDRFKEHTPVMVHVNYHPDKFERMLAVWDRYVTGHPHALDSFPLGDCPTAPNC